MKQKAIQITMPLLPGVEVDPFNGAQLKCAVESFRSDLETKMGIRTKGVELVILDLGPVPEGKSRHAPSCSGAWCDGYC